MYSSGELDLRLDFQSVQGFILMFYLFLKSYGSKLHEFDGLESVTGYQVRFGCQSPAPGTRHNRQNAFCLNTS